jgi:PAS domain S-box-containing protein
MDAPNKIADFIDTSDLQYVSPNNRYSYNFYYSGNGVFIIKSKGFLDEKIFLHQFSAGATARERLNKVFPKVEYSLVWDLTDVSGISLNARRFIVKKLANYYLLKYIYVVGANFYSYTFIKLINKQLRHINFVFYKTIEEAKQKIANSDFSSSYTINEPEKTGSTVSENYLRFMELWQRSKRTIEIDNKIYKCISKPEWIFFNNNSGFKCEIMLIEGNVLYINIDGFIKAYHIDNIYTIIDYVIRDMRFNTTDNRFYTVINLLKVKGIALSARKRTLHYENLYQGYSITDFIIPSNIMLFIFKIIRLLDFERFKHWSAKDSLSEAFKTIQESPNGILETFGNDISTYNKIPLVLPKSKREIIELTQKLHDKVQYLKHNQEEQIRKILSYTGSMTWDDSYVPPVIDFMDNSPFRDVYTSLTILFNDFKEIIQEANLKTKQLEESEDKYRNLIHLAGDVIVVYQDDMIKFVNSRVLQVFGYTYEEVIGKDLFKFVPSEEANVLNLNFKRRVTGDIHLPWMYESVFIHRNGSRIPISLSVGRVYYEGKPASMIIARDISIKKKNDEELERYRNHLEDIVRKRTEQLQKEVSDRRIAEESDRLKTAFLSNMSHEIRTPMNAIISFSNYLKDANLTHEQREEYLNYIQSSGQSLLNLINDIIDFSKIEAKQLSVQLGPCNIDSLLKELYQFFEQVRIKKKKDILSLQLRIPEDNLLVVNTDTYRVKQVLSNLLDNALKFTDEGFIEFGYTLKEENIVLYVKDTGVGIPDDKKEMIFKRFGRLHTADRNISGTGLGLAISKNLARLLNGELWVETNEYSGATFYFKIPNNNIVTTKVDSEIPLNMQKSIYNWNGKKVLIAEDEDLNFKVLQIALSRTGASLIRAKTGKEAISFVVEDNDIELVLMDIQMPEMDGYEAMSLIKKYSPQKPIIAQTAFALLEERKKCIEMGFDDYISKPINLPDLYTKMDVFLSK